MYVGKHPDSKFFNTSYPWLETWHKLSLAPAAPRLGKTPVFSPQENWKNHDSAVWICSKRKQGSRDTNAFNNIVHANIKLFRHPSYYFFINILPETVVSFFYPCSSLQPSSPYIPKRLRQVSYLDMIGRKQQPWSTHCKKKIIINI